MQLTLDETSLPDARVVTFGELLFGGHALTAGEHRLNFHVFGKDPKAAPCYMVGIEDM
jgi:hypothetical protein